MLSGIIWDGMAGAGSILWPSSSSRGYFSKVAPASLCLAALTFSLSTLEFSGRLGWTSLPPLTDSLGYRPGAGPLWGLWTAVFVHADFSHLMGNLVPFLLMAPKVEKEMGSGRFLSVLAVAVPISVACQSLLLVHQADGSRPLIGFSVITSFVFGAYWLRQPVATLTLRWLPSETVRATIPVWAACLLWLFYQIVLAALQSLSFNNPATQPFAHIAAFSAGAGTALVFKFPMRYRLEVWEQESFRLWQEGHQAQALSLCDKKIAAAPSPRLLLTAAHWHLTRNEDESAEGRVREALGFPRWDQSALSAARQLIRHPAVTRLAPDLLLDLAIRLEKEALFPEADSLFHWIGSLTWYQQAPQALLRSARIREQMDQPDAARLQLHRFWFYFAPLRTGFRLGPCKNGSSKRVGEKGCERNVWRRS